MASSWNWWAVALTTAIVFFMNIPSGQSIHCWDCNSAYDPRCNDPFDNHSIALVDCNQLSYPHLEVKVATLCRKTMQKVNGKERVIRSCGWLNSSHEDSGNSCFQRTGSAEVFVTHCTCSTDGCNTATTLPVMINSVMGVLFNLAPFLVASSYL